MFKKLVLSTSMLVSTFAFSECEGLNGHSEIVQALEKNEKFQQVQRACKTSKYALLSKENIAKQWTYKVKAKGKSAIGNSHSICNVDVRVISVGENESKTWFVDSINVIFTDGDVVLEAFDL